jgi:uncharacterized membrane protein YbhN (UPF0104 family)
MARRPAPARAPAPAAGLDSPHLRHHTGPPLTGAAGTARAPRLLVLAVLVLATILALYVLLPRVAGLDETWGRIRDGDPGWIALAALLEVGSYAGYVVLLRAVAGGGEARLSWPDSWRLTLAGVAASRLLATAGAGGIALTAWALSRMGMSPHTVATRMATFFVTLYAFFMGALVLAGLGLRAGWLAGPAPFALTVVPALFGAAAIAAALALALVRPKLGRVRAHGERAGGGRTARLARTLAKAPATLGDGVRGAVALVRARDPALLGALGWWACDVLVLWASLHAFGAPPPAGVLVTCYFVGQLGNTLPLPGGIGGVEGGMVGALVAFGEPAGMALAAVLTYRAFAFWLPTLPGAVAYVQLTRRLGHPDR